MKGREIGWLMVVPISDAERAYLELHGDEPFEEKLEAAEADIYDLKRGSVV